MTQVQPEDREAGWQVIMPAADLEAGWVTRVSVGGREVAVYDTPEGLFASSAYCTHGGADLGDGYFDRCTIECPLHQGCFDVRSGKATGSPATRDLRTYPVRIKDGNVEIRL